MLDFGDCFGSVWESDEISRRLGHASIFDGGYVVEDWLTLGSIERPWERAQRSGGVFNYFSARDFDPEAWRGEYPNPAFTRMTEQDGAWMARILAGFKDELVAAAVGVGQYEATAERYLVQTLISRRNAVLRRYLSVASPLSRLVTDARGLCATDLAREAGVVPNEGLSFRAYVYRGASLEPAAKARFRAVAPPEVCVDLPHAAIPASVPAGAAERYVVVDITNGYAPGPLRAHLYDLGDRYALVGIERPTQLQRP